MSSSSWLAAALAALTLFGLGGCDARGPEVPFLEPAWSLALPEGAPALARPLGIGDTALAVVSVEGVSLVRARDGVTLWHASMAAPDALVTAPLVSDGRTVLATRVLHDAHEVRAYDLVDGRLRWSRRLGTGHGNRPTPALRQSFATGRGAYFVADFDGSVFALETETGTLRWQDRLAQYRADGMAYHLGGLYVAFSGSPFLLSRLNPDTGASVWRSASPVAATAREPVPDGDGILVASDSLRRYDLQSGRITMKADIDGVGASIARDGDWVYGAGVRAWKRHSRTGRTAWVSTYAAGGVSDFVVRGRLYNAGSALSVIDIYTGERLASTPLSGGAATGLTVVDGLVVVQSTAGLTAFRPAEGYGPIRR